MLMPKFIKGARAALLVSVAFSGLSVGGCGGGAGAPAAAAPAAATSIEASPQQQAEAAYVVSSDEIVRNGLFAQGLTGWNIADAVLVPSQLRAGATALNVGWQAIQAFGSTALSPRKSYTLTVIARNESASGTAQLAFHFRHPPGTEAFRTYQTVVASTAYQTYQVTFTAPEYVTMADFTVTTNGTRTVVDSVSLKMRSAVSQTEPIASSAGSYVPAGYALAFNDEFNGTALNRDKWFTRMVYAAGTMDRLNDEKQRYRDNDNHRVANGVLSLVARKVSSTDPEGINYEGGMIRSDWTTRYGYFEARVRMPAGLGVWPGFWLNSDVSAAGRLAWPPEIDIFEFVNNGVEDTPNMLHSNVRTNPGVASILTYADPAFNTTWAAYVAPFNFTESWHTVGALWDPTQVTLYLDGRKIYTRGYTWTYADGTLAGTAHILLNFAVGGAWAGRHGIDDSAFPQAMQVDWVRAYQRVN
jgi:beta-glucanase (GH16 family)